VPIEVGHYYHVIYVNQIVSSVTHEQVIFVASARDTTPRNTYLEICGSHYFMVSILADNYGIEKGDRTLYALSKCRVVSEVTLKDFPMFLSFHISHRFEQLMKGETTS
jgi:hypothetical protein